MKKHYWNQKTGKCLLLIFLAVCAGIISPLHASGISSVSAAAADTSSAAPSGISPSAAPSPQVSAPPQSAEPGVAPSCDEAYYAILDHYGRLTDSSVVKSYLIYGSSTITVSISRERRNSRFMICLGPSLFLTGLTAFRCRRTNLPAKPVW